MGFMDEMKQKAKDLVGEHGDKVTGGIDKAAEFVDDKTGGKHSGKIENVAGKVKDGVHKLDKN